MAGRLVETHRELSDSAELSLTHPSAADQFSPEHWLDLDLQELAGTTTPFRLTPLELSSREPSLRSRRLGAALGAQALHAELEIKAIAVEKDGQVAVAFPNVHIIYPSGTPGAEIKAQTVLNTFERAILLRAIVGAAQGGKELDRTWLDRLGVHNVAAAEDELRTLYADTIPLQVNELSWRVAGRAAGKSEEKQGKPRLVVGRGGVRTQVVQEARAHEVIEVPARKQWPFVVLGATSALAAGCSIVQPVSPPTELRVTPNGEIQPTATSRPEPTPTSFAQFGPEATTEAAAPYPQELSVEEIRSLLGKGGVLAEGLMGSDYEQATTTARISWLRQAGFNVVDPSASNYVRPVVHGWDQDIGYRWDEIAEDAQGNIAGWLQIEDPTMPAGFRYAQGPTWDPNFRPDRDSFTFGLPTRLSPGNRFEVIGRGEFRILVELDSAGEPVRWLNFQTQAMEVATGAENRPEVTAIGAELFDRTTWSERALAVWNNPLEAPLEEHQWFHQYLMGVTRNYLREVGEQNPFGLRSAVQRLIDPPNKARPIITSVTPEEFRRMSQLQVGQLVAGLDRRQQLWLLFELNMTLPEAERRAIPISSVDKAAILTDPLNFFVYYPQTSDDGTREEWPTRFPWLYEDGVQVRRYGRWVGMWAAPTPYQREYLLRALRNESSPELTFYGYTASQLLGTDVPNAIPGYIAYAETDGDLWGLVESPGQIIPEFVVRLIDREGNQSLLPFAYSAEPFTIPHAACWCTPSGRTPPQFIPDIGEGTIPSPYHGTRMYIEPDRWHFRIPTAADMQHAVGNSIMLPEQMISILSEGQRFRGDAAYVNGVLYIENFNITLP